MTYDDIRDAEDAVKDTDGREATWFVGCCWTHIFAGQMDREHLTRPGDRIRAEVLPPPSSPLRM